MVGPTGPRRLRLAIEHLANFRGSSCYFIDLDPRWVKKVLADKQFEVARAYMDHVVDQAVTILKHRKIAGLFTTPKLLEAMGEKIHLWDAGIRGVFCGGTTMAPQYVRYIVEEVLENRIGFYPTYGNTLMGLAASVPLRPEDNFSMTYFAPQPRAVLQVVDPDKTHQLVELRPMGTRGIDHADPRIFHAALSGTGRSHPPRAARALRLGWRRRSPPLWRDGEEHRRRSLLIHEFAMPPHSRVAARTSRTKASIRSTSWIIAPARPLATVSQVNAGIIRKDLARMAESRAALKKFTDRAADRNLRARRANCFSTALCRSATRATRNRRGNISKRFPPPAACRMSWCGATWPRFTTR